MTDDLDSAIDITRKAAAINPKLLIPQVFLSGYLAVKGDMEEAARIRVRVLAESPEFDARKISRGFGAVSPELRDRFDAALRGAGFDLSR